MELKKWIKKVFLRKLYTAVRAFLRTLYKVGRVLLRMLYAVVNATLYAVAFTTLVISIGMNFAPLIDASSWFGSILNVAAWAPADTFQHLPAMAISTAALIALLAYNRGKKQSRSEFFFDQSTRGLDEVYDLLKDQNNDRVIWVRAARSLLQAKRLAKEIELDEYQRAYRLYELRVRNDLYLALTIRDPKSGHRQPLPPHFFFGLPDWQADADAEKTLDEVAIKASNPIEAYTVTIDKLPPEPTLYPLSEKTVTAIFDFLDYPEDFVETLDDVKDWSATLYMHMFTNEKSGAARYVAHRKTKFVSQGEIHDSTPPEDENK